MNSNTMVVPWRRLACGLWRVPKGDITAAYSADQLPRVRTFQHDGAIFTCTSLAGRSFQLTARCYPLIAPAEYHGPEPVKHGYEGSEVLFRKRPHRLGPAVTFVASDPTVNEWRGLLRVLYADGGMFAAGKTYAQLLGEWMEAGHATSNEQEALRLELAAGDPPNTQDEMKARLSSRDPFTAPAPVTQLQLSL